MSGEIKDFCELDYLKTSVLDINNIFCINSCDIISIVVVKGYNIHFLSNSGVSF